MNSQVAMSDVQALPLASYALAALAANVATVMARMVERIAFFMVSFLHLHVLDFDVLAFHFGSVDRFHFVRPGKFNLVGGVSDLK